MKLKIAAAVLLVLSAPLLLLAINPSLHLGGVGLMLGMFGMIISPVALLGALACLFLIWKARD